MKRVILLFIFTTYGLISQATIFQVGATREYLSPNDLFNAGGVLDGDTIEIDAEEYVGEPALAVWQHDNLLIRGVGGMPHLIAAGQYIWGKGIWVLVGNHITVENIEFSGATVPEGNGSGIRLDGIGLVVRHCYFHDNENGILTGNPEEGNILIEFSEFNNNGFGDGFTHNLYIGHVGKLVFQFNYSHHANIGHNLKSRANENFIYYNRIMDEETGNSSRLIDLPNGGFSVVMGNLFMQGNNAPNNNMLGYGLEGLTNDEASLYVINNTFVNKREASCVFIEWEEGTEVSNISNNIFAGSGVVVLGNASAFVSNWIEPNFVDILFVDEPNYDYHLTELSPAVNFGSSLNVVNGISLTPIYSYLHPLAFEPRQINDSMDAGAYEFSIPLGVSVDEEAMERIWIYPNPSNGMVVIRSNKNVKKILLFDEKGSIVLEQVNTTILDVSRLDAGLYFFQVLTEDHLWKNAKIVIR